MIDPITDSDLAGFVDGQLDAMRRIEVEAYLARTPETAARIMAEMHDRDALRQAFSDLPGPGPERNRAAARRLDRSLAWRRVGDRLRRAAVIALLVGAGWLAHSDSGVLGVPDTFASPVDPALVADARQAREAAQIRARLASQRTTSSYDRAGIAAATGITLPDLPAAWSVRDVQIVPGRHGAGVEVVIDAPDLGEISLFAARAAAETAAAGGVTSPGSGETAYWTSGRSVFALSGSGPQATPDAPGRSVITGYALGWGVSDYRGHRLVAHGGGVEGQVTAHALLPDDGIGLAVYCNIEDGYAVPALRSALLDLLPGAPAYDWVAATQKRKADAQAKVLKVVGNGDFTPPPGGPSLPLDRYSGRYRDPWYGDILVAQRGGRLAIDFTHTALFKSALEPFGPDAFRTRFPRGLGEDAVVTFAVKDGAVTGVSMRALSPIADFSFDFQHLAFAPVKG